MTNLSNDGDPQVLYKPGQIAYDCSHRPTSGHVKVMLVAVFQNEAMVEKIQ